MVRTIKSLDTIKGVDTGNLTRQMLAEVVSVDDTSLIPTSEESKKIPKPGDVEWSEYVLAQLTSDERDEKNNFPKAAGLKRLVLKLVGEITESVSRVISVPSNDNNFTAVVEHRLVITSSDSFKVYHGVGEANDSNADAPYSKYPLAIASSRAMGRALRDALNVNTIVAEEISIIAERDDSADEITSAQKAAINTMSRRLKIDPTKFINAGKNKYESMDDITNGTAKAMVSKLNEWQKNMSDIPSGIKA